MHPTTVDPCSGERVEIFLSYNQYFWLFCERLIMVILAWIIRDLSTTYKFTTTVFVWLMFFDLIAFVIAYDDPFRNNVISFNVLKLLIFLSAIVIDKWWLRKRWT